MDLGLDIDNNDTEELRHHIHHLLRDYARTHITTNYIDFTENLVSEVRISLFITLFLIDFSVFKFVEGLRPVPLTDPYSLVIPPDPYDVFSQMHGLSSLAPYDETFKSTNEAHLYLKQAVISPFVIPKSEQVVWDDDCKLYLLIDIFLKNSIYLFTCRWKRASLTSTHIYCSFSKVTTELQTMLKKTISFFRSFFSRSP